MRGVRRVDDIDGVDAAAVFLADALEHALGAGALDPHRDAGIFRLERLGDLLGERQIDRGVIDDLAFLLARPRSASGVIAVGRRRGGDGRGDASGSVSASALEALQHIASGQRPRHCRFLL